MKIKEKKQLDALSTLKSDNRITIKKYTYDPNDTLFISKQKEIFNKLVDERLEEISDLDKKVNSDDLIYRYNGDLLIQNLMNLTMLLVLLIKYEMVKKT